MGNMLKIKKFLEMNIIFNETKKYEGEYRENKYWNGFIFGKLQKKSYEIKLGKGKIKDDRLLVPVENTGQREGTEVVQLYVRALDDPDCPLKSLKGFSRITLAPGQKGTATIALPRETFERWDALTNTMRVMPGRYVVYYGTSSADRDLKTIKIDL